MKKLIIISLAFGALLLSSCSKEYLETAPTKSVVESTVFSTVNGASMALQGMHRSTYEYDGNHDRFGQKSVDYSLESMGDDFFPMSKGYGWFFESSFQWKMTNDVQHGLLGYTWSYYYDLIDNANRILKNIETIVVPDTEVAVLKQRDNIKAQCLFYRAYSNYYLVQIWADAYVIGGANTAPGVPIYTEPTSEGKARSTVAEVYAQIKSDLDASIALFESSQQSRASRMDIDESVVQAIYARVALQTGDNATAVTMATAARTGYALEADYGYGWSKVSTEWIWGVVMITEQQTSLASFFSHIDISFGGYASAGNYRSISHTAYNAMSATDTRDVYGKYASDSKTVGVKYYADGDWTTDYLYIAAGEMYLIEAEAQAMAGNAGAAQTVLFELVNHRDPNYVKSTSTGDALLAEIVMQRRIDLWGNGLRWLDLKRYGKGMNREVAGGIDLTQTNGVDVLSAADPRWVFLIPKQEMDSNPLMVQNPM